MLNVEVDDELFESAELARLAEVDHDLFECIVGDELNLVFEDEGLQFLKKLLLKLMLLDDFEDLFEEEIEGLDRAEEFDDDKDGVFDLLDLDHFIEILADDPVENRLHLLGPLLFVEDDA